MFCYKSLRVMFLFLHFRQQWSENKQNHKWFMMRTKSRRADTLSVFAILHNLSLPRFNIPKWIPRRNIYIFKNKMFTWALLKSGIVPTFGPTTTTEDRRNTDTDTRDNRTKDYCWNIRPHHIRCLRYRNCFYVRGIMNNEWMPCLSLSLIHI